MKENNKYYWLKLKKDFFAQKYVKALRRMPDGDTMVIVYLKMHLASLDNEGRLLFENIMPDAASEIALVIDEDEAIVAKTLEALVKMGICEECDSGDVILLSHDEMVGSESGSAERVRNHRKRKALQCNKNVTTEIEKEKEKEIEIEIEKEIDKEKDTEKDTEKEKETDNISSGKTELSAQHAETSDTALPSSSAGADRRGADAYQEFVDSFNSICTSLPKVTKLTDGRKRAIKAGIRQLDCEREAFFRRVEGSDFLTGREGGWNGCSFDWIMKPQNLIKILEGNYDNRHAGICGSIQKAPQPKDYGAAYDISEFESCSAYDEY